MAEENPTVDEETVAPVNKKGRLMLSEDNGDSDTAMDIDAATAAAGPDDTADNAGAEAAAGAASAGAAENGAAEAAAAAKDHEDLKGLFSMHASWNLNGVVVVARASAMMSVVHSWVRGSPGCGF